MSYQPKHVYNRKKDPIDTRDYKAKSYHLVPSISLPPAVDLRNNFNIEIYDQTDIGSCTANAGGFAFEYDLNLQKQTDFMPARLFIYWNERTLDGDTNQDAGSTLRQCMQAIHQFGVCPEQMWDYSDDNLYKSPTQDCFTNASAHTATNYFSIENNISALQGCLAAGYPWVCGIDVYESFESDTVAQTGVIPMPNAEKEQLLGGHAVACVGYDSSKKHWIFRNSWNTTWGDKGYFYLSFDYTYQYGSDFWTLRAIT
jgi:C1A family cysteine protease